MPPGPPSPSTKPNQNLTSPQPVPPPVPPAARRTESPSADHPAITADRASNIAYAPSNTPYQTNDILFKDPFKRIKAIMVYVRYARDVKFIVVQMASRGLSLDQINKTLFQKVSPDSLQRWNDLYCQTRDVVRDPALYEDRGRPLAFTCEEAEFVLDALAAEPTLYLDEIQRHIKAMTGTRHPISTIHQELTRSLLLTKKVARTVHPDQSEGHRAAYTDHIGMYPPEYLVFVDECGVSLGTHSWDRAWALRGRRTSRLSRPLRAPRISVLPAVLLDGLLATIAQEGTMRRIDMEYFIEEVLVPEMNPFPGQNSILVMDNARIHHGGRIAEICEAANILLIYLPPSLQK